MPTIQITEAVFTTSHPETGASGTITVHEEAGGIALDVATSSGAGRGSLIHSAIVNNGNLETRIVAAPGTSIIVLPNGVGDPLFVWPAF